MKSYRMDDALLAMIDEIKSITNLKTDTKVLEYAVQHYYWHLRETSGTAKLT